MVNDESGNVVVRRWIVKVWNVMTINDGIGKWCGVE